MISSRLFKMAVSLSVGRVCRQICRNRTIIPGRTLSAESRKRHSKEINCLILTTNVTSSRDIHSLACAPTFGSALFRRQSYSYTTSFTQNCWQCGTEIDPEGEQYFCECGIIQPPKQERNFFEVFGFECTFDIDTSALTRKFRELQQQLHPDRFTQKSENEKKFSEDQSSTVNRAYQTLLKPLPRAVYLLQLKGHDIEDGETQQDPDFLMEIMEINELLAETTSPDEMSNIGNRNQKSLNKLTAKLSKAFNAEDIPKAKQHLSRLKYYSNIDDKVKEFEREQLGKI